MPGQYVTQSIAGGAAKAGGPNGAYYVGLAAADVVALITGTNAGGSVGTVNASDRGWAGGDGDQNTEDGEAIMFRFVDYDSSKSNNIGTSDDSVQSFGFVLQKFTGSGANPVVSISVTYSDGSVFVFDNVSVPAGVSSYSFSIDAQGLSAGGTQVQSHVVAASGIHSVEILDVVDGGQAFVVNDVVIGALTESIPDLSPSFKIGMILRREAMLFDEVTHHLIQSITQLINREMSVTIRIATRSHRMKIVCHQLIHSITSMIRCYT